MKGHISDLSSVGKALSAFCSAAGKYLAAVGGRHSLAEAMLFHSVELLGLVCSFHFFSLLFGFTRGLCRDHLL